MLNPSKGIEAEVIEPRSDQEKRNLGGNSQAASAIQAASEIRAAAANQAAAVIWQQFERRKLSEHASGSDLSSCGNPSGSVASGGSSVSHRAKSKPTMMCIDPLAKLMTMTAVSILTPFKMR